ncbi:hypothetical protein LA080_002857 [Diaporthe eres]|nr:hypothetical protein LA080_002857 [Diaporthe eres]
MDKSIPQPPAGHGAEASHGSPFGAAHTLAPVIWATSACQLRPQSLPRGHNRHCTSGDRGRAASRVERLNSRSRCGSRPTIAHCQDSVLCRPHLPVKPAPAQAIGRVKSKPRGQPQRHRACQRVFELPLAHERGESVGTASLTQRRSSAEKSLLPAPTQHRHPWVLPRLGQRCVQATTPFRSDCPMVKHSMVRLRPVEKENSPPVRHFRPVILDTGLIWTCILAVRSAEVFLSQVARVLALEA